MSAKSSDPKAPNLLCSGWTETVKWLEEFPPPERGIDHEGLVTGTTWVFRGLKDSRFDLEPTIEREAHSKSIQWPTLEVLVSDEFKSRARMHLRAPAIPEDALTWLALMQHYAIPTRLLDFTYSPFVALYFAVRYSHECNSRTHVRLWAINATSVNDRFRSVAAEARLQQRKHDHKPTVGPVNIFDLEMYSTDRDNMVVETDGLRTLTAESLSPPGTYRDELNRQGCICVASPPDFNPRLASQQGVFLINCAQDLTFSESLERMMEPCSDWCEKRDIPISTISEIERKLFQMNIHEQSLFPDLEGLGGLIRQKVRLHWK